MIYTEVTSLLTQYCCNMSDHHCIASKNYKSLIPNTLQYTLYHKIFSV